MGLIFFFNTLRPRQNGRHFADDLFQCISVNKNIWISIKISLKFIPKRAIYNIPALVQIMAWRRLGDKRLSEPMIARLPTHICVTRPQWVNHLEHIWTQTQKKLWQCRFNFTINSVPADGPARLCARPATDTVMTRSLQWRHNEHDGVSDHRRYDCLLNCLFKHR